ncbi:hypothetical protein DV736_g3298, partial [Chaetothyriales sp. CBS 134916]
MHITALAPVLLLATTTVAQYNYGSGSSGYGGGSGGYGSYGSGASSSWGAWGSSSSSAVAPAQANPTGSSQYTPPVGELLVQVVSVSDANGSLKYFPDSVQAPVGSIVQFQFHPKNHTVTESTFAEPCKPVALVNASLITPTRPGLKSGFQPVTASDTETPVYNVLINDTKPIWVYCGQTNHCQKGMAMVINQNLSSTDKTIEAYIAAAAQLPLVSTNSTSSTAAQTSSFTEIVATTAPPTSIETAPPATTTTESSANLPAPTDTTGTAVAATTTSGTGPATFTGAAAIQRPMEGGHIAVAGVLIAGVAALL